MSKNQDPVKPQKRTKEYLDWTECRKYIEAKYNCNIRDYAGKFADMEDVDRSVPYQDFWHWIIDRYGVRNSMFFKLYKLEEEEEEWVKEIHKMFFDEFSEDGNSIDFYVWW